MTYEDYRRALSPQLADSVFKARNRLQLAQADVGGITQPMMCEMEDNILCVKKRVSTLIKAAGALGCLLRLQLRDPYTAVEKMIDLPTDKIELLIAINAACRVAKPEISSTAFSRITALSTVLDGNLETLLRVFYAANVPVSVAFQPIEEVS